MDDSELNGRLSELADNARWCPEPLRQSGKCVAYYGWYWRSVDFSHPLYFAYADGDGVDVPGWVGFCQNNKWGYEMFSVSQEQTVAVRDKCVAFVESPSKETATELFDLMQSLKPANVTGKLRWQDG